MKRRLDDSLEFFDIGFTCASSSKELKKLKSNSNLNLNLLEDAYKIINKCNATFEKNFYRIDYNYFILMSDYMGLNSGKSIKEKEEILLGTRKELELITTTFEDILKGNNVGDDALDKTISFFDDLSDNCLFLSNSY